MANRRPPGGPGARGAPGGGPNNAMDNAFAGADLDGDGQLEFSLIYLFVCPPKNNKQLTAKKSLENI